MFFSIMERVAQLLTSILPRAFWWISSLFLCHWSPSPLHSGLLLRFGLCLFGLLLLFADYKIYHHFTNVINVHFDHLLFWCFVIRCSHCCLFQCWLCIIVCILLRV